MNEDMKRQCIVDTAVAVASTETTTDAFILRTVATMLRHVSGTATIQADLWDALAERRKMTQQ